MRVVLLCRIGITCTFLMAALVFIYNAIISWNETPSVTSGKVASRKDIWFLGRMVGFQKSDVTMLKQSIHWIKIGDGWVGLSQNNPKIGYPLRMAPNESLKEYFKMQL